MPTFVINAPNGKKYKVTSPEGTTADQALEKVRATIGSENMGEVSRYNPQSALEGRSPKRGVIDSLTSGVSRSFSRMGSMATDIVPALFESAVGHNVAAKRQMDEAAAKEAELQRVNPTQFKSIKDVQGIGDIPAFLAETIGEQGANIATSLGTGLAGSVIGRRVALGAAEKAMAARAAEKGLAGEAAKAYAQKGAGRAARTVGAKGAGTGAITGAYLGSFAQNAPEVFENIYQETGEFAPVASILTGAVAGALDSITPASALKSLGVGTVPQLKAAITEKVLEKSGMKPSLIKGVLGAMGKSAATEGLTESAQEALSIAAERYVGDNYEALTSKEFNRIVESGIRGAVAGGPFGAIEGVGEYRQQRAEQNKIENERQQAIVQEQAFAAEQKRKQEIPEEIKSIDEDIAKLRNDLATNPNSKVSQFKLAEALKLRASKLQEFQFLYASKEQRDAINAAQKAQGTAPTSSAATSRTPDRKSVESILAELGITEDQAKQAIKKWNIEGGLEEGNRYGVPFKGAATGSNAQRLNAFLDKWEPQSAEQAELIDKLRAEYSHFSPDTISAEQKKERDKLVNLAPQVRGNYKKWLYDFLGGYTPGSNKDTDMDMYQSLVKAQNIALSANNQYLAKNIETTIFSLFNEARQELTRPSGPTASATPTAPAAPPPTPAGSVPPTPAGSVPPTPAEFVPPTPAEFVPPTPKPAVDKSYIPPAQVTASFGADFKQITEQFLAQSGKSEDFDSSERQQLITSIYPFVQKHLAEWNKNKPAGRLVGINGGVGASIGQVKQSLLDAGLTDPSEAESIADEIISTPVGTPPAAPVEPTPPAETPPTETPPSVVVPEETLTDKEKTVDANKTRDRKKRHAVRKGTVAQKPAKTEGGQPTAVYEDSHVKMESSGGVTDFELKSSKEYGGILKGVISDKSINLLFWDTIVRITPQVDSNKYVDGEVWVEVEQKDSDGDFTLFTNAKQGFIRKKALPISDIKAKLKSTPKLAQLVENYANNYRKYIGTNFLEVNRVIDALRPLMDELEIANAYDTLNPLSAEEKSALDEVRAKKEKAIEAGKRSVPTTANTQVEDTPTANRPSIHTAMTSDEVRAARKKVAPKSASKSEQKEPSVKDLLSLIEGYTSAKKGKKPRAKRATAKQTKVVTPTDVSKYKNIKINERDPKNPDASYFAAVGLTHGGVEKIYAKYDYSEFYDKPVKLTDNFSVTDINLSPDKYIIRGFTPRNKDIFVSIDKNSVEITQDTSVKRIIFDPTNEKDIDKTRKAIKQVQEFFGENLVSEISKIIAADPKGFNFFEIPVKTWIGFDPSESVDYKILAAVFDKKYMVNEDGTATPRTKEQAISEAIAENITDTVSYVETPAEDMSPAVAEGTDAILEPVNELQLSIEEEAESRLVEDDGKWYDAKDVDNYIKELKNPSKEKAKKPIALGEDEDVARTRLINRIERSRKIALAAQEIANIPEAELVSSKNTVRSDSRVADEDIDLTLDDYGIGSANVYDEGGYEYSTTSAVTQNPTTPKEAKDALRAAMRTNVDRVSITPTPEAAGLKNINPNARGAVINGKAYLFTDNIEKGEELAVFLHEVGGHIGMEKLIGPANYNFLLKKIEGWAVSKADTPEVRIAKAAMARVKTASARSSDEAIAYFIEEAVKAGVNPTAIKETATPLGMFFRKVMAAIKGILARFGMTGYDPSAQDIVDLAYGAALSDLTAAPQQSPVSQAIKYSLNVPTQAPVLRAVTFERVENALQKAPEWSQGVIEKILNVLSNLPENIKAFFYSLRSLSELSDIVRKFNPRIAYYIDELNITVSSRANKTAERKQKIEGILIRAKDVMDGYSPEIRKEFDFLAHESTRLEIDFSNTANSSDPLYRRFYLLDKPLRDLYFEIVKTYSEYGDAYLEMLDKMTEGAFTPDMKVKFQMLKNRIVPYLPLYREGDFWLRYINRDGESVVEAHESKRERELAALEAQRGGATDIKLFKRLADITTDSVPPTREFTKVLKLLNEKGVNREVIQDVYRTYLTLFPNQSIKQQYRKRRGTLGYRSDTLRNLAAVGSKMANDLSQFEVSSKIDKIYDGIEAAMKDSGKSATDEETMVYKVLRQQEKFMRSPVPERWTAWLGNFNYNWYILGNISSGIVNLTQLPMTTIHLLGGEYGYSKSSEAMAKAIKMYWNGGRDNTTSLKNIFGGELTDKSFMGEKARAQLERTRPDLVDAYDIAVSRGAIRRSTGHILSDLKQTNLSDFTGTMARVQGTMGWVFQNSERMNREVTFLAAYELAKAKGLSKEDAIEKAIKTVELAGGASMSETGPGFFQTGFGKVAGTFKRFALAQLFLQGRLFKQAFKGATKEERRIAQVQFLGMLGAQLVFTGLKGMPFFGALSFLAGMILGDEDDPFDIDKIILQSFGTTTGNILNRGAMSYIFGIDIGSRAEVGMIFKYDPKRMAEIGPALYAIEQAGGPTMGTANNFYEGYKLFSEGKIMRGIEKVSPAFARGPERAVRYLTEGVKNGKGLTIAEDPNSWNIFAQVFGFTPTYINEALTTNAIRDKMARKASERRSNLLDQLYEADQLGPDAVNEIMEDVDKFNQSPMGALNPINQESIRKSRAMHKYIEANNVKGMMYPKPYREYLATIGG